MNWILLLSVSFTAFSAETNYYYAFPQEAGPEWGYGFPECKVLTDKVPKCKMIKTLGKCRTDQVVELTDSLTKKKNKFFIDHHIFKTKSKCDQAAGFIYGADQD